MLGNFPIYSHYEHEPALTIEYRNKTQTSLKYKGITKQDVSWLPAHSTSKQVSWPICNTWIFPDLTNGKTSKEIISEIKVNVRFMSTLLERHSGTTLIGKTNSFSRSLLQCSGATEEKIMSRKRYLEKGHGHTYPARAVIFLRSTEN